MRRAAAFSIMCIALCTLGSIFGTTTLSAQDEALEAEKDELILRRVYVRPVPVAERITDKNAALYGQAGELLFPLITARRPVIRVPDPEEAHSTIAAELSEIPSGVRILFSLSSGGKNIEENRVILSSSGGHQEFKVFLEETAEIFAPKLGRVKPEVRLTDVETDRETQKFIDKVLYEQSLLSRHELCLWTHFVSIFGGNETRSMFVFPSSVTAGYSWYLKPHHGITVTLYALKETIRGTGWNPVDDEDSDSAQTVILPGIGYTYRTSGKLSAGITLSLHAGESRIFAEEPWEFYPGDEQITFLEEGESRWFFTTALAARPFISYSPGPHWQVNTGIFILYPFPLIPDETIGFSSGSMVEISLLNIGFSYKWGGWGK